MASNELVWKLRYQQLNSRLHTADYSYRNFFERFTKDKENLISSDLFKTLNVDEEQLNKKLKSKVEQIKVVCSALKWQKFLTNAKEQTIEEYKKFAEDIKETMYLFRVEDDLRMTDLVQQQHLLERQISGLHQSYKDQEKKPCKKEETPKKLKSAFALNQSKNLPPEVVEFQEFMYLTKRHQQEWSDSEQCRFLKIWNTKKLESMEDLRKASEVDLPSKFPEEILSHLEWYKQYLNKKENKVNALRKWRLDKEIREREIMCRNAKQLKNKDDKWKKDHKIIIKERNEKVLKMITWKIDKQNAVKQAREEENKKAKLKFLQQRRLHKKRADRLKRIINEYHEKKRIVNQQVGTQTENINASLNALQAHEIAKNIGKNWRRDKMIVCLRKLRIDELSKSRLPPMIRINSVKGKRDPKRIFKLTKSYKAKVKKCKRKQKQKYVNAELSEINFSQPLTMPEIPHRKIPSWLSCYSINNTDSLPSLM